MSGWFLLQKVDGPHPTALHTNLAGISIRASWKSLEPQRGKYALAYLDEQFAWAKRVGARVMLRVMAGVLAPAHTYKTTTAGIPTPWEQWHKDRYAALMAKLATRYRPDYVHVSGFWNSAEFHVPDAVASDPHMAGAMIYRFHSTAQAFRAAKICLNHSPEPFSPTVIEAAQQSLPDRVAFQMNALKASTDPDWIGYTRIRDLGLEGRTIGWQFVGPSTNAARFGGPFAEAVKLGLAGRPAYWEVYEPDVGRIPG